MQLGVEYNDWLRAHLERQFFGVEQLRKSPYVDWPAHVHLETFAICNARCTFCPYPTLERKGTRMSDGLIDKILGDLEEIPRDVPFQIAPYKVSEPFLDLRLLDLLENINVRLPHAGLNIFSNGSIMKEDQLRRIARLKKINFLWISLNECDPARYEALMSLPFERTIERLDLLHTLKSSGVFPHKVCISRVMDGTVADAEFIAWVKARFPAFEVNITPRKDWMGQVDEETTLAQPPKLPCKRWFGISIMATGQATMCCMDGQGEWPIGDVSSKSVIDIYNSDAFRAIRFKAQTRQDVPACRGCSYI